MLVSALQMMQNSALLKEEWMSISAHVSGDPLPDGTVPFIALMLDECLLLVCSTFS